MSLDYRSFHLNLLSHAYNNLLRSHPFDDDAMSAEDADFLQGLHDLIEAGQSEQADFIDRGQALLATLVRRYPEHVPLVPRDLFWFFGGECLHFMPDEEIALFQLLDEQRFDAERAGEPFNYEEARANIKGLH
ncbi:PA2817 family protein [Marinobacterium arenosum]|uniref:PA2817 family protein n=1 Tax=Marinobacterium arenosum TaxID=2862496 RepID=UPI001C93B615|nr:PA2817 family protein [Marinobacterium arenosum]MBY4675438.1 hypothetical protein [Marinobacterium arenosum]